MQVILKQDVPKLGQKGQLINVKKGYFMNFLMPNGFAQAATKNVVEKARELTAKIEAEKAELAKNAEQIKDKLAQSELHIEETLTDKGTLYAKVTATEIAAALKDQLQVQVEDKQIDLKKPIKEVGKFDVNVKLSPEVTATVKVVIEGKA